MPHSLRRVWIHGVLGTKHRMTIIDKQNEQLLFKHIQDYLLEKFNCYLAAINGTSDHIHILFLYNAQYSLAQVFKGVKGESARWWNEQKLSKHKFVWQTGYGAFSVSESMLKSVVKYIEKQKQHHATQSFIQEMDAIVERFEKDI